MSVKVSFSSVFMTKNDAKRYLMETKGSIFGYMKYLSSNRKVKISEEELGVYLKRNTKSRLSKKLKFFETKSLKNYCTYIREGLVSKDSLEHKLSNDNNNKIQQKMNAAYDCHRW